MDGMAIARERIAKEAAEKTGFLNLGRLGLTALPDELFQLTHLRALHLGDWTLKFEGQEIENHPFGGDSGTPNRFSDCLDRLSELPNLAALSIAGTDTVDLKPLASLTTLQTLHCFGTKVSDLTPVASLQVLQTLDCSGTQVSDLTPIASLLALQWLDCSDTPVSDLTPIASLLALQWLDCSDTPVSDLTPVASLPALHTLYLMETKVSDLAPLNRLMKLRTLWIDGCTGIENDGSIWDLPELSEVDAGGAEIRGLPSDILTRNCLQSVRAHLADLGDDPEPLPDIKLMVLGNGRIGKTQIVNRLRNEAFEPQADSTHGVMTTTAPIPGGTGQFNIWDFGGQDIYHGTHALFLKSRAVFLLVWTPDSDNATTHEHNGMDFRNKRLSWWLNYVRRFGDERSPLIVVQNQLDRFGDKGDHDAIRAVRDELQFCRTLAFSAKDDDGRGALNDYLKSAARSFNPPLIGKGRLAVMRQIQALQEENRQAALSGKPKRHRTMSRADFDARCAATGQISNTSQFLHFLHNAGIVFWREGLFGGQIILDQSWLLDAIYTVFNRDLCLKYLRSQRGRFTRADLAMLTWEKDGYSEEEQELFLQFMQTSGICFTLRRGTEDREAEYIAPDLLPEEWDADARAERWGDAPADHEALIEYEAMPPALLRNLMGQIGERAGLNCDYWRNGLYGIERTTGARLLIEQDLNDDWTGSIRIQTRGGQSARLLEMVRKALAKEERTLGLQSKDPPNRDHPSLPEIDGEATAEKKVPALDQASFGPEPRTERTYFVSYAWDDTGDEGKTRTKIVDDVCDRALARSIDVQRDKNVLQIGDRISRFMRRLVQGDRIIVVLSEKYLESEACMYELYEIWLRVGADRDEFLKRIRIFTHKDAKIWRPVDRAKRAIFWQQQADELDQLVKEHGSSILGEEDSVKHRHMRMFSMHIGSILATVADTLQPRSIDELERYTFDDFDD